MGIASMMVPVQAVVGPDTPQTAPPAQALQFGNFKQQDAASGFASPPQAISPVRSLKPLPMSSIDALHIL